MNEKLYKIVVNYLSEDYGDFEESRFIIAASSQHDALKRFLDARCINVIYAITVEEMDVEIIVAS